MLLLSFTGGNGGELLIMTLISLNPCPKCGGKRCNDPEDKNRYGHCLRCGARWFIIRKEQVE
jgi:hypothetical protein